MAMNSVVWRAGEMFVGGILVDAPAEPTDEQVELLSGFHNIGMNNADTQDQRGVAARPLLCRPLRRAVQR